MKLSPDIKKHSVYNAKFTFKSPFRPQLSKKGLLVETLHIFTLKKKVLLKTLC